MISIFKIIIAITTKAVNNYPTKSIHEVLMPGCEYLPAVVPGIDTHAWKLPVVHRFKTAVRLSVTGSKLLSSTFIQVEKREH